VLREKAPLPMGMKTGIWIVAATQLPPVLVSPQGETLFYLFLYHLPPDMFQGFLMFLCPTVSRT
jgi:hypothetical protein